MIARKTFQLTAPNLLARPVPVTAEVTTWVVDTGEPKQRSHLDHDRAAALRAEAVDGCSLVIFSPSVRIRRKEATDR